MSMSDPIADLLTRMRNNIQNHSKVVNVPFSRLKTQILEVLKREGFIRNFEVVVDENKKEYFGLPQICRKRISCCQHVAENIKARMSYL